MAPPISFCPVDENIALATKPVAELLGENFKVLSYTIKFNNGTARDFALGFSKASPMECYDYEKPDEVTMFLELDPEEPKELRPPFAAGTCMYVNMWRNPTKLNHVYIAIKIGDFRSGTYAFTCHANQDYLAIRCKPSLVIGGFIDVMTTEQFLGKIGSENPSKCVMCLDNHQPVIFYDKCGHVCYCVECAKTAYKKDQKCPFCGDAGGFNIAKDRVEVKSLYCVNCIDKRCSNLNALNLPCRCLLSCSDSVRTSEPCAYCETTVEDFKKIFLP